MLARSRAPSRIGMSASRSRIIGAGLGDERRAIACEVSRALALPPPLWGRAGWGVAARENSLPEYIRATPTPAPPHKGEGSERQCPPHLTCDSPGGGRGPVVIA